MRIMVQNALLKRMGQKLLPPAQRTRYSNPMRFRVFACAVVIAGVQLAQASFELMYIPSVNDDKIYRFDPANQVSLGSINSLSPTSVLYRGGQFGAVTGAGGNHRYDMYSGINQTFLNSSNFSSIGEDGTTLFGMSGTNAFSSNLLGSGTVGSTALSTTFNMFSGVRLSNGNMVGLASDGTSIRPLMFSSVGAVISSLSVHNGITLAQGSNSILTTTNSGQVVFHSIYRDTTGTLRMFHVGLNSAQNAFTSSAVTSINSLTYNSTSVASLAVAHNGYYVVGSDASSVTSTRITQFNNFGIVGTTIAAYTAPIDSRTTGTIFSVGMVIAPEPASFAVLGLGLVPFFKRRKKTSSP